MQILKRTLAAAAALAFVATAAQAQPKAPDFSGTWELNTAKSDFGPMAQMAPTKATVVVTQTATSIKLAQSASGPMGEQTITQEFTLDGKESTTDGPNGAVIKSTAKPDGDALVINSKIQANGQEFVQTSRYTLAADGKSLMVDRQLAGAMGEIKTKMVFDKK
jgi:hypothetical protein